MSKAKTRTAPPLVITEVYNKWLERFPLQIITTEEVHKQALAVVGEMMRKGQANLKPEELAYLSVLALLVQTYEQDRREQPKLSPGEMLEILMDEHGLKQSDLTKEMGSQAAVSYVLRGERLPTRDQIGALSKRFHVSPAVFYGALNKTKVDVAPKSQSRTTARKGMR